jgi:hypothetical protein
MFTNFHLDLRKHRPSTVIKLQSFRPVQKLEILNKITTTLHLTNVFCLSADKKMYEQISAPNREIHLGSRVQMLLLRSWAAALYLLLYSSRPPNIEQCSLLTGRSIYFNSVV